MNGGDLLLTRHLDEESNMTPGYWNHVGIYSGGYVIESLMESGVIKISMEDWLKSLDNENYIVVKPVDVETGWIAANIALKFIGYKYRLASTIMMWIPFFRKEKGFSCIGLVRECYKKAFKEDPLWMIPDDILKDKRFILFNSKG